MGWKEVITTIILVIFYLAINFVMGFSLITHIIINLLIASFLCFILFKQDESPIKKGLLLSAIIFVIVLIANMIIISLQSGIIADTGIGLLISIISTIKNPITYFISFVISFNLPFIIKTLIKTRE